MGVQVRRVHPVCEAVWFGDDTVVEVNGWLYEHWPSPDEEHPLHLMIMSPGRTSLHVQLEDATLVVHPGCWLVVEAGRLFTVTAEEMAHQWEDVDRWETAIQCTGCGEDFVTVDGLADHRCLVEPVQCVGCGRDFHTAAGLADHRCLVP